MTKGPLRCGPPSPPGWRNEPHALSHPFPSCSAPACSSTEPPCCQSETLGCRRDIGGEIRDHPPSPPVSIAPFPAATAQGSLNSRAGSLLFLWRVQKGKDECFMWRELLLLVLASFLPLCRSSAPDSSRAFVSIRVTGLAGLQGRKTGRDPQVFYN